MILPAQLIRQRCKPIMGGLPMLDPFCERTVHVGGMSYGLSSCGYDVRVAQSVTLRPGDFKLLSTFERFAMPSDLVAFVHDKSTWARLGLAVQNTVIEPGWRGFLTLELTNHGGNTLIIEEGAPIAQIIWHRLDGSTDQPYEGKYQDQDNRPVQAKLEGV